MRQGIEYSGRPAGGDGRLATVASIAEPAHAAEVTLSSPLEHQVIQRDTKAKGRIAIVGDTRSTNFPTGSTRGPPVQAVNGGERDGILVEVTIASGAMNQTIAF